MNQTLVQIGILLGTTLLLGVSVCNGQREHTDEHCLRWLGKIDPEVRDDLSSQLPAGG